MTHPPCLWFPISMHYLMQVLKMNSVYSLFVWWVPIVSSSSGFSAALKALRNDWITWFPYMSIISCWAWSWMLVISWINILWDWLWDSEYLNPFILLKSSWGFWDLWIILAYELIFSFMPFESFSMSSWMTLVPWRFKDIVIIVGQILSTII